MNFLFVLQMMAAWYVVLVLVVWLVAVLAFRKFWRIRYITLTVLVLSLLPPIYLFRDQPEAIRQKNAEAEDMKKRYTESKTMFDELCKSAGVKVTKKPEMVKGVLLRVQVDPVGAAVDDQFYPSAALHSARDPQTLASVLLRAERRDSGTNGERGFLEVEVHKGSVAGFDWVEIEGAGGKNKRYVLDPQERNLGIREIALTGDVPRYAIDVKFDVDPVRRKNWIAGGTVEVIDLRANEVVSSFVRYVMDPGQGNRENGRSPWRIADSGVNVCPARPSAAWGSELRVFVSDVFLFSTIK